MYTIYFRTPGKEICWSPALTYSIATQEEAIAVAKAMKEAHHTTHYEFAVSRVDCDQWVYKTTYGQTN